MINRGYAEPAIGDNHTPSTWWMTRAFGRWPGWAPTPKTPAATRSTPSDNRVDPLRTAIGWGGVRSIRILRQTVPAGPFNVTYDIQLVD